MHYLHQKRILHRDLKLSNILIDKDRIVNIKPQKIADFGLAVSEPCDDNRVCGTPNYIAPEVLQKQYSEKSEVWAVGCVLYALATGKPPF